MDAVLTVLVFLFLGLYIGWWELFALTLFAVLAMAFGAFLLHIAPAVRVLKRAREPKQELPVRSTASVGHVAQVTPSDYLGARNNVALSTTKSSHSVGYLRPQSAVPLFMSSKPHLSSGLIIVAEPLERILSGHKTWEMRSRSTVKRETIALIQKGSGAVFGVADIVNVIGPLSPASMLANISLHQIETQRLSDPKIASKKYAWVLSNVRRLNPSSAVRAPSRGGYLR